MKQRRLTIASFLVIAILILTVGFAALNDNLLFDGSANVGTDAAQTAFDGNVYFSNAEVGDSRDTASIITNTVAAEESDTIQFTISSLGLVGETATVTGTITNKSERFNAKVTLNNIAVAGLNPDMFEVLCYDAEGEGKQIASSGTDVIDHITIAKTTDKNSDGVIQESEYSTHKVKIVVRLKDSPNANGFSATIAVRLDVVAEG